MGISFIVDKKRGLPIFLKTWQALSRDVYRGDIIGVIRPAIHDHCWGGW
jgi:hypothetical protein